MPAWKVLLIVALSCLSLGLAMATLVIGVAQEGSQRWAWLGGLSAATACAGTLLTLFMRHAGRSLDASPRGSGAR